MFFSSDQSRLDLAKSTFVSYDNYCYCCSELPPLIFVLTSEVYNVRVITFS